MTSFIVADYKSIAQGLRTLERERAINAAGRLVLPAGSIILLSAEYVPSLRLPGHVHTVFMLHESSARPALSLIHSRNIDATPEAMNLMVECLRPEFPSVRWISEHILMSADDCKRLAQRVRDSR